ncbi:MAG: hypothetical protein IKF44_01595 [Mycoplasmataceae bacterium]|nr:hypothetical protein [Mycoplasmataceae bacterium]
MIIKQGIKEIKINIKAIKSIFKTFKENIKARPYEDVEFVIVLLLIIEGKLPLEQAQDTFLNWYNGGKKWIEQ